MKKAPRPVVAGGAHPTPSGRRLPLRAFPTVQGLSLPIVVAATDVLSSRAEPPSHAAALRLADRPRMDPFTTARLHATGLPVGDKRVASRPFQVPVRCKETQTMLKSISAAGRLPLRGVTASSSSARATATRGGSPIPGAGPVAIVAIASAPEVRPPVGPVAKKHRRNSCCLNGPQQLSASAHGALGDDAGADLASDRAAFRRSASEITTVTELQLPPDRPSTKTASPSLNKELTTVMVLQELRVDKTQGSQKVSSIVAAAAEAAAVKMKTASRPANKGPEKVITSEQLGDDEKKWAKKVSSVAAAAAAAAEVKTNAYLASEQISSCYTGRLLSTSARRKPTVKLLSPTPPLLPLPMTPAPVKQLPYEGTARSTAVAMKVEPATNLTPTKDDIRHLLRSAVLETEPKMSPRVADALYKRVASKYNKSSHKPVGDKTSYQQSDDEKGPPIPKLPQRNDFGMHRA